MTSLISALGLPGTPPSPGIPADVAASIRRRTRRGLMGQLLGERAATRDAKHIDPPVTKAVEQVLNHPGQPSHAARPVKVTRSTRVRSTSPG